MPKKKKSRRPSRAARRATAAKNRPKPPAFPHAVDPEQGPEAGPLMVPRADTGWLRFLPPSAASILDRNRPVAEMFGEISADEPMWTWWEDEEDESPEELARDEYPHLTDDEVTQVAAEWDVSPAALSGHEWGAGRQAGRV